MFEGILLISLGLLALKGLEAILIDLLAKRRRRVRLDSLRKVLLSWPSSPTAPGTPRT